MDFHNCFDHLTISPLISGRNHSPPGCLHPDDRTKKGQSHCGSRYPPEPPVCSEENRANIQAKVPLAAADIAAPPSPAAGGQCFPVYQLPFIGVVGDRQAKEVGLLHVVWLALIFLTFKVMQMHGVVQSISPGKQGAASASAQIGPTHPAWEGWLPAPTIETAETPGRSLDGTATPRQLSPLRSKRTVWWISRLWLFRPAQLLQALQPVRVGGDAGGRSWVRFPQPISSSFLPRTWGRWSPGVTGCHALP